jgi:transcriptional regulator with XRE-family HTH domain
MKMKKTNLDLYIESEIQKDPSLESRLGHVDQAIDIAIQIYNLRKQKNLTQAQLASAAHVKQSNIARLENADYDGYSKKTLEKIARALNVNLAIFFVQKEHVNNVNRLLEIANNNKTSSIDFSSWFPDDIETNCGVVTHINNTVSDNSHSVEVYSKEDNSKFINFQFS